MQSNRKTAVAMMSRIFRKHISKQVKVWHYNALPTRKLELINNELSDKFKDDYDYVAKMGAVESLGKLNSQIAYKAKIKAFRLINQHMFNKRIETDH